MVLDCTALLREVETAEKIIVYGARLDAAALVEYLGENGLSQKILVAVGDVNANEASLLGHNVCDVRDLTKLGEHAVIILAVAQRHQASVEEEMRSRGFSNVIRLTTSLLQDIYQQMGYPPHLAKVDFLVVACGQACTLRCRDCANFSPYATKETRAYPIETILQDLQTIMRHTAFINRLQIQGGEPFLYPQLAEVVDYAIGQKTIRHVTVATNGTLIPRSVSLLAHLKDSKVDVRISNYQSVSGMKSKIEALEAFLEENSIRYRTHKFASRIDMWSQCGSVDTPREDDDAVVKKRFDHCAFRGCLTLENSQLGYCSRSTIAGSLQRFEPNCIGRDLLHVRDADNFAGRLADYMANKHFMECCRYCYGTQGALVSPAIQLA